MAETVFQCYGCGRGQDAVEGGLEPVAGKGGRSPRLHCEECREELDGRKASGLEPEWNT